MYPGIEFLENDSIQKLFKAHENEFKNFKVEENKNVDEVILLMINHLIENKVFDMFVTIPNEYTRKQHRVDPAYKIKEVDEFYRYAKIDLYAIYAERKNTEVFEVLTFLLQQLLNYIPFPSFDNDYMDMDMDMIREIFLENIESNPPEESMNEYLTLKEYDLIMTPFEDYVKSNTKTFSLSECLDIIPKESYWYQFSIDVFEFLKKPSTVYGYSFYFNTNDTGFDFDFQPLNCSCYWGFTWDSPGLYFQQTYIDWINIHSREITELSPLLTCTLEETFDKEYSEMKHLYNFLNKHNANR